MWAAQTEVTATNLLGVDRFFKRERDEGTNPINAAYRTSDGRFLQLVMLEADRHWPELCDRIGRQDLVGDPRFADMAARRVNAVDCVAVLAEVFGSAPAAHWRERLDGVAGVWALVATAREAASDPQVLANGYARAATSASGTEYVSVSTPLRFEGVEPQVRPAPEHGAHTDEVLAELLGLRPDELIDHKVAGAIL
jgi:crotonobetainyl-CoA:carnitine CoA-transferase CaiB-like acyl-CoA transferase